MYVYLIGAGPGDPGLLTLKGAQALACADIVVYDYLASDELLALANKDAEFIYVGKKAGNHALPQAQINQLLIDKAREFNSKTGKPGKIIARLKGGDPYIFGRGGEEAEELVAAHVPFEEIPGISSTIAGPAYAGIPLTHRAMASSVTLITGHENPDKPGSVHNWKALAQSASTLVFVMGMKNLPDIAKNLIDAGLSAQTPSALVHWGTTSRQRSLAAPLCQLHEQAVAKGFSNPSVIVVGEVVRLRDTLNWFEKRPLFGRNIVVTRAREQASGMAAQLRALGANVLLFPTIEIIPMVDLNKLDDALLQIQSYQWLLFTSVNGVKVFAQRLKAMGKDARALACVKVAAIGPATAEAVATLGIMADYVPDAYIAESVAKGLIEQGMAGKKVLLPRALEARDVLPEELMKAGAIVNVVPVYQTLPATEAKDTVLEHLEAGTLHCVTFGSSSTVRNFMESIPAKSLLAHPEIQLASIGPITGKTLEEFGLQAQIQPADFTIPALVQAISAHFNPVKA